MELYYSGTTGLIHLVSAFVALAAGTAVLAMRKGTLRHRQVGWVYALAMAVLLVTAFMLYNLFGGWGIFHWAAVISSITVLGGMIPIFRRTSKNWVISHFAFMYWSVFGLYAAFFSEVLTRVPEQPFFGMVGVATFATMGVAGLFWRRYKKIWAAQFVRERIKPRGPLFRS